MSWLEPGIEVLARLRNKRKWAKVVVVDPEDKERARRARKAVREKLWRLKNPGKRRSYDRNLRARVAAWQKANPEKVKASRLRYEKSEKGRERSRLAMARYRARKRAEAAT